MRRLPDDFTARTLVLRQHSPQVQPFELRNAFADVGLAVTAYQTGEVRLSIPSEGWSVDRAADVANRVLQVA